MDASGSLFVKIQKNHNHPLHTLIRLICDHNLPVWFRKPNNFSNSLKIPTLPSFLMRFIIFFYMLSQVACLLASILLNRLKHVFSSGLESIEARVWLYLGRNIKNEAVAPFRCQFRGTHARVCLCYLATPVNLHVQCCNVLYMIA